MSSRIPIITSAITSMPEVAGDAALLVNPTDLSEIKNAMLKIYVDENLRKHLIENGIKRKAVFNWDVSAKKLWESIEKCLS